MLDWLPVSCPWCGECFETAVDASAGAQQYVEDCQVCCRPIVMHSDVDGEGIAHLRVAREGGD